MQADVDYANAAGFGYSFTQLCINPVGRELPLSANAGKQTQTVSWPPFDYLYLLGANAQVPGGM
jgi:hypothetical protein